MGKEQWADKTASRSGSQEAVIPGPARWVPVHGPYHLSGLPSLSTEWVEPNLYPFLVASFEERISGEIYIAPLTSSEFV